MIIFQQDIFYITCDPIVCVQIFKKLGWKRKIKIKQWYPRNNDTVKIRI